MKRHTPPYTGPRPTVVDAQRILRAIPLYAGHLGPREREMLGKSLKAMGMQNKASEKRSSNGPKSPPRHIQPCEALHSTLAGLTGWVNTPV